MRFQDAEEVVQVHACHPMHNFHHETQNKLETGMALQTRRG